MAEMRRLTQRKWPCSLASQVNSSTSTSKQVAPLLNRVLKQLGPECTGPADPQGPSSVLKIRRGAGPEGARVLYVLVGFKSAVFSDQCREEN